MYISKKKFSKIKKLTPTFYLQMFCALSGGSLSWNTPVFIRFLLENTQNFIGCLFFHSHVLRYHSKAQLPTYCGKRAFLGVAKSWKVTLDRVPWFGRHVENLGDVIIYIEFWLRPGLTIQEQQKQQNRKKMKVRQWWKSDVSFVSKIQLKSVIPVCKRAKKLVGITDAFYGCERDKKIS